MKRSAVLPVARPVSFSAGWDANVRTCVLELEDGENEHGDELCQGEYGEADEHRAERSEDDRNERDRQYELERAAVGGNAGELRRQQVVDDERHRVWQIEKVRERPDPAVRDGDPPSGRFLTKALRPPPETIRPE